MRTQLRLLALLSALTMVIGACGPGCSSGGGDDDDDTVPPPPPVGEGCDTADKMDNFLEKLDQQNDLELVIECGKKLLLEGEGKDAVDVFERAVEIDESSHDAQYGKMIANTVGLVDSLGSLINEISNLAGGLRQSQFSAQQLDLNTLIDGIISGVEANLQGMADASGKVSASSEEFVLGGAIPLELGAPGDTVYIKGTIGLESMSEVIYDADEAGLVQVASNAVLAILNLVLSHNLKFDLGSVDDLNTDDIADRIVNNAPLALVGDGPDDDTGLLASLLTSNPEMLFWHEGADQITRRDNVWVNVEGIFDGALALVSAIEVSGVGDNHFIVITGGSDGIGAGDSITFNVELQEIEVPLITVDSSNLQAGYTLDDELDSIDGAIWAEGKAALTSAVDKIRSKQEISINDFTNLLNVIDPDISIPDFIRINPGKLLQDDFGADQTTSLRGILFPMDDPDAAVPTSYLWMEGEVKASSTRTENQIATGMLTVGDGAHCTADVPACSGEVAADGITWADDSALDEEDQVLPWFVLGNPSLSDNVSVNLDNMCGEGAFFEADSPYCNETNGGFATVDLYSANKGFSILIVELVE